MLRPGDRVELAIEKPAAGGRMIARHEGQVVLVLGGIPGERVRARVERVEKRLAFAATEHAIEPSADRRETPADPLCGGCVYAHIAYRRQVAIKQDVIREAFERIGRLPLEFAVAVAPSAERGYRMRARLHVHGARAGFYREGTHEICDAAGTGQLTDASIAAALTAVDALAGEGAAPVSIELTENIAGTERAVHADLAFGARVSEPTLARAAAAAELTGCTARPPSGVVVSAGNPTVGDPCAVLTGGRAAAGEIRRHPESFFQANRYLLPDLVAAVVDAVLPDQPVLDLYAGVGLFCVSVAASGHPSVVAVEGDRSSGRDLQKNAAPWSALRVVLGSVEEYARRPAGPAPSTIVVDPPRTGVSRDAMDTISRRGARRIVYVSCDPPTMARDARRLVDAGYVLRALKGFDLFPNTPHVETLGVFDRAD